MTNPMLAGGIDLTTKVTGTLPVTNGGNGLATAALGDLRYGSGTNTLAALAGNTSATLKVLTQTGNGSVSAAPAWNTLDASILTAGNLADARNTVSNSTTTSLTGAALAINPSTTGTIDKMNIGATTPGTVAMTSGTFTTSFKSTTALATPSGLSATQFTAFASTVSGATIMGYGTTGDVTLKNRAGTDCLTVGPNNTEVKFPGIIRTNQINDNSGGNDAFLVAGMNFIADTTGYYKFSKRHVWASGWPSAHDVSLGRSSAGVLQIGDASANSNGSLLLTNLTASGTLSVGGGPAIQKICMGTATLDFGSVLAGAYEDRTITVTGATTTSTVAVGVPNGSVPGGGAFFAWVSAADTVTVRFFNNNLTIALDPASGTYRATVTNF